MDKPNPLRHVSEIIRGQSLPTISRVEPDGRLVELVYHEAERKTRLAVWDGADYRLVESLSIAKHLRLEPYAATNNLIRHKVVLFPSEPEEYGSTADLLSTVQAYIRRYVDLSPAFERLAAHYVLLTWVYDRFNELPYLRLRGDYGSGKTRFLLTVGAICYKPIFASGASTVSPIFHLLDSFGGTLVLDEADFRFSDAKAELVKILNNGNARGFPVLRTESKNGREFNPRAFQVFGPKIVAMRGQFDDPALESRFLTEHTGSRSLRDDIPLNLPQEQESEALALRNKLLLFRFRNFGRIGSSLMLLDPALEPRLNQIYGPLAAVMDSEGARRELRQIAVEANGAIRAERSASVEAQVLTAVRYLLEGSDAGRIALKDIADVFGQAFGADYERHVTSRWIGRILRRNLGIATAKSHGVFVIPITEREKLKALFERYGVTEEETEALAQAGIMSAGDIRLERVDFGELGDTGSNGSARQR
jgi:hypothetical protein